MKKYTKLIPILTVFLIFLFFLFNPLSSPQAVDCSDTNMGGDYTVSTSCAFAADSATTTVADSSTNANTGTPTGTTIVTGKYGSARSFNGSSDYISLPNDIEYTTQVSAFAWFKSNGAPLGDYHIIFGGQELEISIPSATGELRTGVYTTSRFVSNHGSGLTDGEWHHVGFTFDGSTKKSYIDGAYVGEQAVTGTLTSSFANRTIGRHGDSAVYYANGIIDDARIYNYARSADQVTEDMNNRTASTGNDPVARWKMDDGYTSGVDNGNLTVATGNTLTVNAGQTVVWNPSKGITIENEAFIAINTTGQLKQSYLWVSDSDTDSWYFDATQVASDTQPTGFVRRKDTIGSVFGDGSDGAVTFNTNTNINTTAVASGRTLPDAALYTISSIGMNSVTESTYVTSDSGIRKYTLANNLTITPEKWGGATNAGEFDITCPGGDSECYITDDNGVHPTTNIDHGIACGDGNTGTGYIMYSATSVHTRFSGMHADNATYYACVRYSGGNWQYDNNTAWTNFTPVSTDTLVAQVDFSANTVTDLDPPSAAGFSSGDTALLINLRGDSTNYGNVGNYELLKVSSGSDNTITFTTDIKKIYGATSSNSDLTGQKILLQRVPQYTNVTVNEGVTVDVNAWSGTFDGGVLAMQVNGTYTANTGAYGGGTISMAENGYRGGDCNGCANAAWGDQGEGIKGYGTGSLSANGNGGGGGYGPSGFGGDPGAGGGHASAGGNGVGGGGTAVGGSAVGEQTLGTIFMGGGAGAGGDDDGYTPLPQYVSGGGIIMLFADTISSLYATANGENGIATGNASGGVSGSGAGGSILIKGRNVTLSTVTASGGTGASDSDDTGGVGSAGRIAVYYTTSLSGTTTPSAYSSQISNAGGNIYLAEVSEIAPNRFLDHLAHSFKSFLQ